MKNIFSAMLLLAAATFFFSSCKKDKNTTPQPQPAPQYYALGEAYNNGLRIALFSDATLQTGYERLYVALFDSASGNRISEAAVALTPVMDMGTMVHSAPVENPASTNAVNQYFPGAAVFTMPGNSEEWSVQVTVLRDGNTSMVSIPVSVVASSPARVKSFVSGADGASYFVALLQPRNPIVGINDLELAVFKKESMMSFPADSSMSIAVEPEMPSMGHGSPNNVNPTHAGSGHYKGKVNFTMTGSWRLNLDFNTPAGPADTATYFEINF